MRRFLVGVVAGLVLGSTVVVSAQYVYPGLYTAKALTEMQSGLSAVYAYGVVDALIARNFHLYGGGAGAKHLNGAYTCLANRLVDTRSATNDFVKWVRTLWSTDPNRNGALLMIDRACQ